MQNLIIEAHLAGPAPAGSRLKLMWTPHPAAPFANFLLVGVDHERLALKLWDVFGERVAEHTDLRTRESFARELNFQYRLMGQRRPTRLQAILTASVVVKLFTHTNSMVGAEVRLMGTTDPEVIFKRRIKSVTNYIYTPR
jgi:hypothetical protein